MLGVRLAVYQVGHIRSARWTVPRRRTGKHWIRPYERMRYYFISTFTGGMVTGKACLPAQTRPGPLGGLRNGEP